MELVGESTLCDDVSLLNSNNNQNQLSANNKVKCHYCDYWCPTQNHSEEHIKVVHGLSIIMS